MALKVGELYGELTLRSSEFDRGIAQAESKFSGLKASIAGMAAGMVKTIGAAMAGAVTAVVGFGTKFNAQMEQSQIAWETLLGSGEKAQKMIQDLQKLGAETPFEFEGLDKAGKLLYMAKIEGISLTDTLRAVGDAVSAVGGGQAELEGVAMALFQMSAKGKVSAEEMNQMAERGIPVWEILAQSTGKSVQELMKMSEQGKLFAKDALPAIVEGMEKRFGGAMQKQSQTFNGMISTLKDNLGMLAGDLTKPFFEWAKSVLPIVIDIVNRISDAFKSGGFAGIIKELLPPDFANGLINTFNTIKNVISGAAAFIAPLVKNLFSMIVNWWKQNGQELLSNVRIVFQGIMAVINFALPFVKAIVLSVFSSIKGIISGALNVIMGIFRIFAGLLTGDWSKLWQGIKDLVKGAIQLIWNIWNLMLIGKLLGGLKAFGSRIVSGFSSMWQSVIGVFKSFVSSIRSGASSMVSSVVGFFSRLWKQGVNIFNTLRAFGVSVWNALFQAIRSVASNIYSTVVNRIKSMATGVKFTFQGVWSTAVSIFNRVKSAITNPIETAKNIVLGIINKIKSAFKNLVIKIPKPKLPHIKVASKKILGVTIPTFNIDWYKTGGIFNSPSVIGVGEAGAEAVIPLAGRRMKPFAYEIAKQMAAAVGGLQPAMAGAAGQPIIVDLSIDGRRFMRAVAKYADEEIDRYKEQQSRAEGII